MQDLNPVQGNASASSTALATELRLRLLESLVGLDTLAASKPAAKERSIARRGQAVVQELYDAVDRAATGSEPVKRFLEACQLWRNTTVNASTLVLIHALN